MAQHIPGARSFSKVDGHIITPRIVSPAPIATPIYIDEAVARALEWHADLNSRLPHSQREANKFLGSIKNYLFDDGIESVEAPAKLRT